MNDRISAPDNHLANPHKGECNKTCDRCGRMGECDEWIECYECGGAGTFKEVDPPDAHKINCPYCNGKGYIRIGNAHFARNILDTPSQP